MGYGMRRKGNWMANKRYGFVCISSWRSVFGFNCIFRYIISHIYHLSVNNLICFFIFSIHFIFISNFLLTELCEVLGVRNKGIWLSEKRAVSLLFVVRG